MDEFQNQQAHVDSHYHQYVRDVGMHNAQQVVTLSANYVVNQIHNVCVVSLLHILHSLIALALIKFQSELTTYLYHVTSHQYRLNVNLRMNSPFLLQSLMNKVLLEMSDGISIHHINTHLLKQLKS